MFAYCLTVFTVSLSLFHISRKYLPPVHQLSDRNKAGYFGALHETASTEINDGEISTMNKQHRRPTYPLHTHTG